jgi:hypothetical protein
MKLLVYATILTMFGLGAVAPAADSVPNNLDEAFTSLDRSLKPSERLAFIQRPEREAVASAHFAVGLYIRNQWLRSGKSALVGLLQAKGAQSFDDMSGTILTSYWRHVHGLTIKLEEQGACYRRWGSEQRRLIDRGKANNESSYHMPDFYCS